MSATQTAIGPASTTGSTFRVNPAGPVRAWPAVRVDEAFEILAGRQPAAPAILSDAGTLTYAELDQKANALAHALLAQGVTTEEAVGVLTERSASLPLGFLAILKAGELMCRWAPICRRSAWPIWRRNRTCAA